MIEYFTFDLDPELCCEICNETIHNHFECPICKKYTGAGLYHHWDDFDTEIECENCQSIFKFIEGDPYFKAKWKYIKQFSLDRPDNKSKGR